MKKLRRSEIITQLLPQFIFEKIHKFFGLFFHLHENKIPRTCMHFDPENKIVKLCAEGMSAEIAGEMPKAKILFLQAWEAASDNLEKFIAAHYVARHQSDANETLRWNLEALNYALDIEGEIMKGHYPSLYLNIGKSYEDLSNAMEALNYYRLAESNSIHLSNDPYGDMIRLGIRGGLARMENV
jgi:rifampin ADP-ribosylating transferase